MSTLKAIRDSLDENLSYNKETACFLEGDNNEILSISTSNNPASVAFDWEEIWPKIKALKSYPEEFIMIHTHPPGMEEMSSIDRNMVHGWVRALGRPIWFSIICERKFHLYYCRKVDGKIGIEDHGFLKISEGLPNGDMIQMVMRGVSQSVEDYSLDDIVLELNATFNRNRSEKQTPVWPELRMSQLANLGLLLKEVEIINQRAGVCERIIWCQTLAASMLDKNAEETDSPLIEFLNNKAWGL